MCILPFQQVLCTNTPLIQQGVSVPIRKVLVCIRCFSCSMESGERTLTMNDPIRSNDVNDHINPANRYNITYTWKRVENTQFIVAIKSVSRTDDVKVLQKITSMLKKLYNSLMNWFKFKQFFSRLVIWNNFIIKLNKANIISLSAS